LKTLFRLPLFPDVSFVHPYEPFCQRLDPNRVYWIILTSESETFIPIKLVVNVLASCPIGSRILRPVDALVGVFWFADIGSGRMPVAVHPEDYAFSADYGIAISELVIVQLRSLMTIAER